MVRKRSTKARNTRRRQRGGGFFNGLRSFFGRFTRKQQPTTLPPGSAPVQQSPRRTLWNRFTGRRAKVAPTPAPQPSQRRFVEFQQPGEWKNRAGQEAVQRGKRDSETYLYDTESRKDGIERSYGWLLDLLPIRTLNTQEEKTRYLIQFAEEAKHRRSEDRQGARDELQRLILHVLYNTDSDRFELPEDEWEEILYGTSLPNKPNIQNEFGKFEKQRPSDKRYGWNTFGTVNRAIAELFTTQKEEQYAQNIVDTMASCRFANPDSSKAKSFDAPGCVTIYTSILDVLANQQGGLDGTETLVVHPSFSRFTQRYRSEFYRTSAQKERVNLYSLPSLLQIQDAFADPEGITYVSPHLCILLQEYSPRLWTRQFSIFTDYDVLDRVVLATFQKYSVFRRFLWTKNRLFTNELYKVSPTKVGDELRNPQLGSGSKSGYEFPVADFNAELIQNQLWVAGQIRYSQLFDPKLDVLFGVELRPQNTTERNVLPWMTEDSFVQDDLVEIPQNPLEEQIRAQRQANPELVWTDFLPPLVVQNEFNMNGNISRGFRRNINLNVIPAGTVQSRIAELETRRRSNSGNLSRGTGARWNTRRRKTRRAHKQRRR